jgi:hypothetical protein
MIVLDPPARDITAFALNASKRFPADRTAILNREPLRDTLFVKNMLTKRTTHGVLTTAKTSKKTVVTNHTL